VLAFLEALCGALAHRDTDLIRQLLQHPLAAALPAAVREEARRVMAGEVGSFAAPLQALRLYHQTAHLLGVMHDAASRHPVTKHPPAERVRQMELPLPARVA
jgi:hypothetical protein